MKIQFKKDDIVIYIGPDTSWASKFFGSIWKVIGSEMIDGDCWVHCTGPDGSTYIMQNLLALLTHQEASAAFAEYEAAKRRLYNQVAFETFLQYNVKEGLPNDPLEGPRDAVITGLREAKIKHTHDIMVKAQFSFGESGLPENLRNTIETLLRNAMRLELHRLDDRLIDSGLIDIEKCARCGKDHNHLEMWPFIYPVYASDGTIARWWSLCPSTGEPLLIGIDTNTPNDL